jgi:hypothetical protein
MKLSYIFGCVITKSCSSVMYYLIPPPTKKKQNTQNNILTLLIRVFFYLFSLHGGWQWLHNGSIGKGKNNPSTFWYIFFCVLNIIFARHLSHPPYMKTTRRPPQKKLIRTNQFWQCNYLRTRETHAHIHTTHTHTSHSSQDAQQKWVTFFARHKKSQPPKLKEKGR